MNAPELRSEIARAGKTYGQCAEVMGISAAAFGRKMQGQTEFKNSEIKSIAAFIGLGLDAVNRIFFDEEVN